MNKLILISSLLLVACGGGDSDTSSGTTPKVGVTPEPVVTTADLSISPQFDLTTDVQLTLSVAPDMVAKRAFINVCQAPEEGHNIDYDGCYLRSPLDALGLESHIILPHQGGNLVAEIWYYDTDTQAMQFYWQFDPDTDQQIFKIN